MNKYLIIYLLGFFWSINSFAQNYSVERYQILIGKTKSQVIAYFNELYSHTTNPYKKIETSYDEDGDLKLKVSYAMSEEDTFSCLDVEAGFTKIGSQEICWSLFLMGSQQFGERNIEYLKNNFIKISPGNFEGASEVPDTKIKARLLISNKEDSKTYAIYYTLSKN